MNVLVVDDDQSIIQLITKAFMENWSDVGLISTTNGSDAIRLTHAEKPEIIILDLGLPDVDGIEVLRQIRRLTSAYVVILTARNDEGTKILGLQDGADDYITKPFSVAELIARLKALIRRKENIESRTLVYGKSTGSKSLIIDFKNQAASVDGRHLRIGPRQYVILQILTKNRGTMVSKLKLLAEAFPEETNGDTNFVDVYIKKLQETLEENPNEPRIIIKEGDGGYKFVGSFSVVTKD